MPGQESTDLFTVSSCLVKGYCRRRWRLHACVERRSRTVPAPPVSFYGLGPWDEHVPFAGRVTVRYVSVRITSMYLPLSSDPRRPHLRCLFCVPRPCRPRLHHHRPGAPSLMMTSPTRLSGSLIPMNHELLMSPQATLFYVCVVSVCPPRSTRLPGEVVARVQTRG